MFEVLEHRHPLFVLIVILVASNIFFAWSFFKISHELESSRNKTTQAEVNVKVLDFTSLFIKEVLQADSEVDFETRLALENAVRDLKDEEIKASWQTFIGSKTEASAQDAVKNLLELLVSKIRP